MRVIDFYPSKGCFRPGETAIFEIELEAPSSLDITLLVSIKHFSSHLATLQKTVSLEPGVQIVQMQWTPPEKPAGYSAQLEIISKGKSEIPACTTCFDILSSWTDFPRYGFLTDFSAGRPEPEAVLKKLTRFHINGLQLYDWQYRHDQLLAPADEYIDPLGREMSLASVRRLVDAAHERGMAAMPYLAIYAASAEFWRSHPGWALYDEAGKSIAFGDDFLGLMDPSQDSPWSQHLLNECARALEYIPFDGLHIDQYGEPKLAWDSQHHPVDLPKAFVDFIKSASDQHTGKTILFNAVGNWPIDALSGSDVDFLYIEVWPPKVGYRDLAEIVLHGTELSHGKAVVIALYLPSSRPANNLLADLVILACGGTRIELGEDARLLSDPYFPKHEEVTPELSSGLRRLSDFAVRSGEWLRPYNLSLEGKDEWSRAGLNPDFISTGESLWTVARKYPGFLVISIVNFNGLNSDQRWDEAHSVPIPCQNMPVGIQTPHSPSRIFWDIPENNGPREIDFEYQDGTLKFQVPQINTIGLVAIYE